MVERFIETNNKSKSFEKVIKDVESKKNIFWHIESYYIRVIDYISTIPKQVKWFIQRGKRGWADVDTWSFDSYLSEIISQGITHLAKNVYGTPNEKNMTLGKWIDILWKIHHTFDWEKRICEGSAIKIPSNKSDKEYEKMKKEYKIIEKRCKVDPSRIMTRKEVKEYEEGWKLFKKYFNDLWD